MNALWQDVRYGLRMLGKSPGFTTIAVLTLALGIGANSAIFSVINALLFQPLPYENADRLVRVTGMNQSLGFDDSNVSYPNFMDIVAESPSLEGGILFRTSDVNFAGGATPERLSGARITPGALSFLGIQPVMGRLLIPEDRIPGGASVVMISVGLWQQNFGGAGDIIGKAVMLDSEPFTVVGVVPGVPGVPNVQVWRPLVEDAQVLRRNNFFLGAWARLADGATIDMAHREIDVIAKRLEQAYPDANEGWTMRLTPLQRSMASDNGVDVFYILLATVGLVLLIGCANIANLLLSRSVSRRQELGIRSALGGERSRLVRQLLTESVLLSVSGGVVGLVLSVWGLQLITAAFFDETTLWSPVSIDMNVVIFTLGLSVIAGLIFGVAPALQATGRDLNDTLKQGAGSLVGDNRHRLRSTFMASEIALAIVLLSGAAVLLTAFYKLTEMDPGFEPRHLLSMRIELPRSVYTTNEQSTRFYQDLERRLNLQSGVTSAAIVSNIPIGGGRLSRGFIREGDPEPPREQTQYTIYQSASAGYFTTMKIPVVRGREFTSDDRAESTPVAVINEVIAKRLWPNENPIGKLIRIHTDENFPRLVVGVTGNARTRLAPRDPMPQVFVPLTQNPWRFMSVVVRTQPDAVFGIKQIRDVVADIDPTLPVYQYRSFEAVIDNSLNTQRNIVSILGTFAMVALLLASIGIYGVVSAVVSQRTREIGIRMALGAGAKDVLRLIMGQGMIPTFIGLVIGLAGAVGLVRVMSSNIPGITADPVIFLIVCLILFAVVLLATYIPARRAVQVDPCRH